MKTQILSCSAILFALPLFADGPSALSEEGQERKAIHDFLFETFAAERETVYRDEGLKELTIFTETHEIRDGDEIVLPDGAERIAVLFRHFGFHGENLDRIKEVRVFPFSPDKSPPRSAQVADFYRVQMPTIPAAAGEPEPLRIKFLMKEEGAVCRIDDLVFYAQIPILPEFDDIPFRDLGSEHSRERVEIHIDTKHELSIGGSADLQRERWFRMHVSPGAFHESFERWAHEKGFLPARSFVKFNPALTNRKPPAESLKESADRPGAADLAYFERNDSSYGLKRTIPAFRENTFLMCFNDWPEFMSVPLKGRGTPLVERFDDAAELAAAFVEDQVKDAGYTATWWEVKNESSVKSEWDHHWEKDTDGWALLADFHNLTADAIHARTPEVKVGGPASAYMQLQVKDFELYRSQARFIELTRGHIDFFSHHFYENIGSFGAYERRDTGYSNYLLGRYEACLDMLRAHMHKVDNVLPMLITETGTLQNGRKPSESWFRLMAWSAYLNKSMQRPDQIDLFVPFIFLQMHWNPLSGDAAFTPKQDRDKHWVLDDFEPTTATHFFDLWQDFDGRRLPVSFERDWLDVVAVHDGDRISLAVTNMGGRQIAVDLSEVAKKVGATGAMQKRLNYHKGEVVFEPEHTVDAAAIPVDVNETTVIRLTLPESLEPTKTLQMERLYAKETAVKSSGEPISFTVETENLDEIETARLIIGIHRNGGVTQQLQVSVNGDPFTIDTGDAHEFTEFFAPLDAELPVSSLKESNTVEVKAQAESTITSVQIVTNSNRPTGSPTQ